MGKYKFGIVDKIIWVIMLESIDWLVIVYIEC